MFWTKSWDGCHLLLVPLWEQREQASPGPIGSLAEMWDCPRVPAPDKQSCVRGDRPQRVATVPQTPFTAIPVSGPSCRRSDPGPATIRAAASHHFVKNGGRV